MLSVQDVSDGDIHVCGMFYKDQQGVHSMSSWERDHCNQPAIVLHMPRWKVFFRARDSVPGLHAWVLPTITWVDLLCTMPARNILERCSSNHL